MKKILTACLVLVAVCSFSYAYATPPTVDNNVNSPAQAPAADNNVNTQPTFTLTNPLEVNSIGEFVQNAVSIFSYLVILLAVLAFIWTGLQYILARGNTEKMKEATKRLGYIVIGVAIVIGARLLIQVVINTLQATGTINPKVIESTQKAIGGQ